MFCRPSELFYNSVDGLARNLVQRFAENLAVDEFHGDVQITQILALSSVDNAYEVGVVRAYQRSLPFYSRLLSVKPEAIGNIRMKHLQRRCLPRLLCLENHRGFTGPDNLNKRPSSKTSACQKLLSE